MFSTALGTGDNAVGLDSMAAGNETYIHNAGTRKRLLPQLKEQEEGDRKQACWPGFWVDGWEGTLPWYPVNFIGTAKIPFVVMILFCILTTNISEFLLLH